MKNIIIAILVLTVGVLGYMLFIKSDEATDNNPIQNSQIQTSENEPPTRGRTIDLSNQGLNEIPKNILDDKSVTTLDVSGNSLTGALPAEIRMLTNLEVLIASDNNLTGIPAEIGQLSKLRIASFANNDISGLPLEIGNLGSLETLDLTGNPNVSDYDLGLIQTEIPNAKLLTD